MQQRPAGTAPAQRAWGWARSNRLALAAVIVSTLVAIVVGTRADIRLGDVFMTSLSRWDRPPAEVVIITIDEDTLAQLPYRSPIDRGLLADIVDHIAAAGPKTIGIDILIDQASEPAKDARLRASLSRTKIPLIMAFADKSDGLTDRQTKHLSNFLAGLKRGHVALSRDDFDGTLRRWSEQPLNAPAKAPSFAEAVAGTTIADRRPADTGRIVYYSAPGGGPAEIPTYPAHAVKLVPKEWFAGKIVLIGSTLPNLDQHRTPFAAVHGAERGTLYGITIHAHMVVQLLRGDRIVMIGPLLSLLYTVFAAFAAVRPVRMRGPLIGRIGAVAAMATLPLLIAIIAYTAASIQLPVIVPTVAFALTAAALAAKAWHEDRAERLFIQRAFAQYVSPAVVERITADRSQLRLGGEMRDVTYVFTDLEGFTSLSEQLAPEETAALLNAYLDGVCNLFVDHGATIDKIIGDAVAGFFGAPEDQAGTSERAVRLVLALDRFCEAFRQSRNADGVALGVTRIGAHRGPAVIGNFGGSRFFDYTGIGDTVNTAARLEAANSHFGTRICLSETVRTEIADVSYRPIGDIVLKGKSDPVTCFEPIPHGAPAAGSMDAYDAAFSLLHHNDDGAGTAFDALSARYPCDLLVRFHCERLRSGQRGAKIVLTGK